MPSEDTEPFTTLAIPPSSTRRRSPTPGAGAGGATVSAAALRGRLQFLLILASRSHSVLSDPHMTIRESIDAEGPVILVDTIEDHEFAIAHYDLPIILPEPLADELGFETKPDDPAAVAALLDPTLTERRGKNPS